MSLSRRAFTLIEILIALTVLVIGLVGILALLPVGLKSSRDAVEDSVTTIQAESIKNAIVHSIQKTPAGTPVTLVHDGVKKNFTFNLPPTSPIVGADFEYEIPNKVDISVWVFRLGQPRDAITWVHNVGPLFGEDPYSQYSFKFKIRPSTNPPIPNLYEVKIIIFRGWQASKVVAGVDTNQPVNTFSTMVIGN